jgi:hypothetical protein
MKKNNKYILNAVDVVVENVVASIDKKKALEESVKFLGKEIIYLENEDFRFAIKQLKSKLEACVPEFLVEAHTYKEIDASTRKLIAHTVNAVEGMNPEKRNILIAAITDYDEMVGKNNQQEE